MLEPPSVGRLADSPTDLTLCYTDSDPSSPWSKARRAAVQGELTYGFLRNVQVAMQRDMANMLSIGLLP